MGPIRNRSVRTATAAYERDQDTVGRFVEESCHVAVGEPTVKVATAVLRDAYAKWCDDCSKCQKSEEPGRGTHFVAAKFRADTVNSLTSTRGRTSPSYSPGARHMRPSMP